MEKMWLIKDFKVPLPAERSLWWNPHQGKYLRFDVSQKYAVAKTLLCPGDWLGDVNSFICFKWLWTHDTRESGSVRDKPKPEWLFSWWIHSSSFQRRNMTCSSSMIMEWHDYASPLSEHLFFAMNCGYYKRVQSWDWEHYCISVPAKISNATHVTTPSKTWWNTFKWQH